MYITKACHWMSNRVGFKPRLRLQRPFKFVLALCHTIVFEAKEILTFYSHFIQFQPVYMLSFDCLKLITMILLPQLGVQIKISITLDYDTTQKSQSKRNWSQLKFNLLFL